MSLSCPQAETDNGTNDGINDPVFKLKSKTSSDIHFKLRNPGEQFAVENSYVGTAPAACQE